MEKLTDTVTYIGTDDPELELFEGQYRVPHGMAYNSYFIDGDKIAVTDGVDASKAEEWLSHLDEALHGRQPDYLIVHHLEPDHSGSIEAFAKLYPEAKIVLSKKAATMVPNFLSIDVKDRLMPMGEGDKLDLGDRTLTFINAPMVHWPEVMLSYDDKDKILFSADAFGKFGLHDSREDWDDEARRYYINIVGKYGPQVQALLKKAGNLDIDILAPTHGNWLKDDLGHCLDLYSKWSSYTPEENGVLIAAASAHGHTRDAALQMKKILEEKGEKVEFINLNRDDVHQAVALAYKYPKMVLAANSYDAGVFPPMERFLHILTHKNFQNRVVGIIQNGSWAPSAAKTMKEILHKCKNLTFVEPEITIKTTMTPANEEEMNVLADHLIEA